MSNKPNKLIAVGMRFIQEAKSLQEYITRASNSREKLYISLKKTDNINGVDGISYAVVFKGQHVAYIRNKDIPDIVRFANEHKSVFNVNTIDGYFINSVTPNYWILTNDPGVITFTHQNAVAIDKSTPAITEKQLLKDTEKDTKMNTNSMRDSFFREVKNVAIDVQSGKFGVLSSDGISVYDNGTINVNPIVELGIKIPAFAIRVPVEQLSAGDIILNGAEATFFSAKTEFGYEVVTLSGEVKQVGQVSNMFFGKNTVLAVKNMFGEGTNPMMMAMLMSDDLGNGDNKNLMMAMAMSGGFNSSNADSNVGGMNPLMLMMLMK